jgi:hypothetical protein
MMWQSMAAIDGGNRCWQLMVAIDGGCYACDDGGGDVAMTKVS